MQEDPQIRKIEKEMKALVDHYVDEQDFHAVETPLKTDKQFKEELRQRLQEHNNFAAISRGIFNAVELIQSHLLALGKGDQVELIRNELANAFIHLETLQKKHAEHPEDEAWFNNLNPQIPLWTALYGITDETLVLIYELVLKSFKQHEIQHAKDLLQLLLMFAPTISSYWNAMGFCFQTEGELEKARDHFLISNEIDPSLIETYFYLARCYQRLNQPELAQDQIDKVSQRISSSKELSHLWKIHVEQLTSELSNFNIKR